MGGGTCDLVVSWLLAGCGLARDWILQFGVGFWLSRKAAYEPQSAGSGWLSVGLWLDGGFSLAHSDSFCSGQFRLGDRPGFGRRLEAVQARSTVLL